VEKAVTREKERERRRGGRGWNLCVFLPAIEDGVEAVTKALQAIVSWIDSLGEVMPRQMLAKGVSELIFFLDQRDQPARAIQIFFLIVLAPGGREVEGG
jgi:hypothetical protein